MKDLKNLGIVDYLSIVWRRRWYAIIAAVLVASGVSAIVWRLPNLYKSETRVLVESPMVPEDYVRPITRTSPSDRINSISEQIGRRTFLERIVEQFQYGGYRTNPKFLMEDAVRQIRKQIAIEKTSDNTFTLSFTSSDPQISREVTQRLADELIRSSTASRMDKAIATDQFIDGQLREAAQALAAEEEKIKQFKSVHLGELPEQSDSNMNAVTGLNAQLTATENALQQTFQQQKALEYRKEELKRFNQLAKSIENGASDKPDPDSRSIAALEANLAVKRNVLSTLQLKYTSSHPDVISLSREIKDLEQEMAKSIADASGSQAAGQAAQNSAIMADGKASQDARALEFDIASIKNQIEKREKDRAEILQQIKAYNSRLNRAPAVEQEMAALLREEEILKQQYFNLQNKKFSSQIATNADTDKKNEIYKIIDEPNLPVKPIFPNRIQYLLMGIGGGILLGMIAAFGRELLDTTIGSEKEAQSVLNLPVLATIFEIPKRESSARKLLGQKVRMAS
jgi:polysaccharide biosynthesis transport protein